MLTQETQVYDLQIWFDPTLITNTTIKKYEKDMTTRNEKVKTYLKNPFSVHIDAGVDLYVPEMIVVRDATQGTKINTGIKAAMTLNKIPVGYYLYPRSSMGSKTPLRLANSVGIIDSGYRGPLIGVVDNLSTKPYDVNVGDRLFQICSPNLTYPIRVTIVNGLSELGMTERSDDGFGSTGR